MRIDRRTPARWLAAAVLSIGAASPALAGSVTRPGDTMGAASGAPVPPGFYLVNTSVYECRKTKPRNTCAALDVPIIQWSTPRKVLGARLELVASPIIPVHVEQRGAFTSKGAFGMFGAAVLAWDLGDGWSVAYWFGGYTKRKSDVAFSSANFNQRLGVSYTGDGWNLTVNAINGIQFDKVTDRPQASPCPPPHVGKGCNPNFLNFDLTATKRLGKWEVGSVGTISFDLNKPVREYRKQKQVQLGGLVGYAFEKVTVQAMLTTNVYEKNYGGNITSGGFRLIVPLGKRAGQEGVHDLAIE